MPMKAVKKKTAVKKSPAKTAVKKSVRTVAMTQVPRLPSSWSVRSLMTHVTIAGTAIAILLILGSFDPATFSTLPGKAQVTVPATQIGLEYSGAASLEMLFARKNSAGYLSISNPSSEPLSISVPDTWERTEVRGAPIASFTSQPPDFGFRRWTMPPKTGMSMLLPTVPENILFESPSASTAGITVRSVDVLSGKQFINVVLLNKEVQTALWQE